MNTIRSNEKGSALLIVLGTMLVLSLLTASVVLLSQASRQRAASVIKGDQTLYQLESAIRRALWYLAADLEINQDRSMPDNDDEDVFGMERFVANGRPHWIETDDKRKTLVRIYDFYGGMQLSEKDPGKLERFRKSNAALFAAAGDRLKVGENRELKERWEAMLDQLEDYRDTDRGRRISGREREEYWDLKIPALPRDGELEAREELAYIESLHFFFPPDVYGRNLYFDLIIPGVPAAEPDRLPQIFSVSDAFLLDTLELDESREKDLLKLMTKMRNSHDTFEDVFSGEEELLQLLKDNFAFDESGYYLITAEDPEGAPGRLLQVVVHFPPGGNNSAVGQFDYCFWQYL